MMSTLKNLLGDNADDKIQNAMNMLKSSGLLAPNDAGSPTVNAEENTVQKDSSETENANIRDNASGTNKANMQNMLTPEGMQFVSQMRSMVEQISNSNDSRSNLLRSLRPFMRTNRQRTIDRAIRIMNIGRISGLFGR